MASRSLSRYGSGDPLKTTPLPSLASASALCILFLRSRRGKSPLCNIPFNLSYSGHLTNRDCLFSSPSWSLTEQGRTLLPTNRLGSCRNGVRAKTAHFLGSPSRVRPPPRRPTMALSNFVSASRLSVMLTNFSQKIALLWGDLFEKVSYIVTAHPLV